MKKGQKYDLSNVGGQPKDWLQRVHESGQDNWWQDTKMVGGIVAIVVLLAGSLGALVYGLLKLSGKL